MSNETYDMTEQANNIANTLEITDKTKIEYIQGCLELAHLHGQRDQVRASTPKIESMDKLITEEEDKLTADYQESLKQDTE